MGECRYEMLSGVEGHFLAYAASLLLRFSRERDSETARTRTSRKASKSCVPPSSQEGDTRHSASTRPSREVLSRHECVCACLFLFNELSLPHPRLVLARKHRRWRELDSLAKVWASSAKRLCLARMQKGPLSPVSPCAQLPATNYSSESASGEVAQRWSKAPGCDRAANESGQGEREEFQSLEEVLEAKGDVMTQVAEFVAVFDPLRARLEVVSRTKLRLEVVSRTKPFHPKPLTRTTEEARDHLGFGHFDPSQLINLAQHSTPAFAQHPKFEDLHVRAAMFWRRFDPVEQVAAMRTLHDEVHLVASTFGIQGGT